VNQLIDERRLDRMLAIMNGTSPFARRVVAAYAVGIGPAVLLAVLFFGGQVITPCLGFQCPPPTDGPIPIIGTAIGFRVTVGLLAVVWLLALVAVSWSAIRRRGGRIIGLVAPAAAGGLALGVTAAVYQIVSGDRLRSAAVTGITVAALAAAVVWIASVTLAAWQPDRSRS
jgi:hypothetical protein